MAQNYYCKRCGAKYSTISALTSAWCLASPTKHHELYEGSEKAEYFCKHCGAKYSTLSALTKSPCLKSPTTPKRHEPAF